VDNQADLENSSSSCPRFSKEREEVIVLGDGAWMQQVIRKVAIAHIELAQALEIRIQPLQYPLCSTVCRALDFRIHESERYLESIF